MNGIFTWNPLMALVLIGILALLWGGWVPAKIEVIWVPGVVKFVDFYGISR